MNGAEVVDSESKMSMGDFYADGMEKTTYRTHTKPDIIQIEM